MFDQQEYAVARAENPTAFQLADEMLHKYLSQGQIVVRGAVTHASSGMQRSEIEVLSFNWDYGEKGERRGYEILLHLKFLLEEDIRIMDMSDALFIDGPLWNGKRLLTNDVVNQIGLTIHGWIKGGHEAWASTNCPQFVGFLNLRRRALAHIQMPYHPCMLPILRACFGYLRGSRRQKVALIEETTSSSLWAQRMRTLALASLEGRLGAFIMQAQREAARMCFGDLV